MIHRTLVAGLLMVLGSLSGTDTSYAGEAGSRALDLVALTDRVAVDAFLRDHAGDVYENATLGDFRTLKLDADGQLGLIATTDSSGRRFFNHLLILYDDGKQVKVQEIDIWNMESLDGAVQDLDGDGQPELLLRQSLTPYSGTRQMAAWTAIFRFDGQRVVDQSARFSQFYETQILPQLEIEISATKAKGPDNSFGSDILEIERDKILRTLGQSEAGLVSALDWSRSVDPMRRIFALAVLTDIGGPQASSALREFADDRDPEISAVARIANSLRKSEKAAP
jgi:hypothetical protein